MGDVESRMESVTNLVAGRGETGKRKTRLGKLLMFVLIYIAESLFRDVTKRSQKKRITLAWDGEEARPKLARTPTFLRAYP